MTLADLQLRRHLAWVLALKLLVLWGLWKAFVAPQRVAVDAESAALRVQGGAAVAAAPAASFAPPSSVKGSNP